MHAPFRRETSRRNRPRRVRFLRSAKRALIPIENKRQFLEVNPDVLEHVDPIFYGDQPPSGVQSFGVELMLVR